MWSIGWTAESLVGSDGGNDGTDGVDHEGEHYRTVAIDGKVWMAENMRHKPAGAQLEQEFGILRAVLR